MSHRNRTNCVVVAGVWIVSLFAGPVAAEEIVPRQQGLPPDATEVLAGFEAQAKASVREALQRTEAAREQTIARWEEALGRSADLVDFYEMYAGFRFAVVMMSLTRLFIADGSMPADTDFDRNNTVTQCLAPMLGLPPPGGID